VVPKQPKINPQAALIELLDKYENSQRGLTENRAYYESEQRPEAIGIAVPPEMRKLLAHVGYCRLYVDSIVDRLEVTGFRLANQSEADSVLWDWWQANFLDVEAPLGHADAFIHGKCFLTASRPGINEPGIDPNIPILRVEPPTSIYADIHPRTRQVTKAIRVANGVTEQDSDRPTFVTVYLPNETIYFERSVAQDWRITETVKHNMGAVPVVPLANRSRLSDLYGTSQITPELRSITDAASAIMMDLRGAAELMALPQRLIFGVKESDLVSYEEEDPETGETLIHRRSALETYMSHIIALEDHDAKAMQFSAADLRNFTEVLNHFDKKVATYTGLPPSYLTVTNDNPASAEAMRAAESRLIRLAELKAQLFGGAWEEIMRMGYRVMGMSVPPEAYRMETVWADPATPTYAAKADAASKLYANGAGLIPREQGRIDMGYSEETRRQMRDWDKDEEFGGLTALYASGKVLPSGATDPNAKQPTNESGNKDKEAK
jgi:hypothetical protein